VKQHYSHSVQGAALCHRHINICHWRPHTHTHTHTHTHRSYVTVTDTDSTCRHQYAAPLRPALRTLTLTKNTVYFMPVACLEVQQGGGGVGGSKTGTREEKLKETQNHHVKRLSIVTLVLTFLSILRAYWTCFSAI